jgi:hypothetical protein
VWFALCIVYVGGDDAGLEIEVRWVCKYGVYVSKRILVLKLAANSLALRWDMFAMIVDAHKLVIPY